MKLEPDNNLLKDSLTELFECTTEGILISDSEGCIIHANPSAHRLFGYENNSLPGKIIEDLIPERYVDKHKQQRQTYNEVPHPRPMGKMMNLSAKKKNGTAFPVEISLSHYIKDSRLYIISFIRDITERKEHEESIKRLNQELEKKVNERTNVLQKYLIELEESKKQLTEALEKEKELNSLKSRFITMASHEFRTPLSTILSSMTLIERYYELKDHEKHQKHVNRVKSSIAHLTLILGDFLSTEKLNEGFVKLERTKFSLKKIVSEVIVDLQNLKRKGQEINFVYEGNEIVFLDRQMIQSTLVNLVSNAIKFSGENKKIGVNVSASDEETCIQVSDEGLGIPEKEHEYIFQRFFRASNASNVQGTGIGLSIVAKYLELMNGKIEFKSELQKGTTFSIWVPNN